MSVSLGLNRDPGSEWSEETHTPEPEQKAPTRSTHLVPCPDCHGDISPQSESCPHCGRFIQYFDRNPIRVLPGKGWSWAVAGGIILSYVVAAVVGGFLLFVLAGALADLGRSTRP